MSRLKFIFYAGGIGFTYWYFGILQEKITRTKHEPGSETFTCTATLVLLQCIFNSLFAKFIMTFIIKQGLDTTRSAYYGMCSLTFVTAMLASNMALQHVNYPTQVVGKSCKPIPIMILGVLFGKKRYPISKYLFVSLIVAGVAMFMYKKNIFDFSSVENQSSNYSMNSLLSAFGAGELLLLLSLTMDGLTGAVQERMKTEHRTKSVHMMYKMNLWSTVYLTTLVMATNETTQFLQFIQRHPNLIYDIALFASLSAIGQLFIFLTVTEFGPLPCSIITTTRKFFTVLTSVFLFGNNLSMNQWGGTFFVFLGLTLDAIFGKSQQKNHVKKID